MCKSFIQLVLSLNESLWCVARTQETEGLQDLEFEHVLDFQDPHLVGVAKKKLAAPTPDSRSIRDEAAAGKRRTRKSSN